MARRQHPQAILLGEVIAHAVDLSRFSADLEQRAVQRLLEAAKDIAGKLAAEGVTPFRQARLEALLVAIAGTLDSAMDAALRDVARQLRALAKAEASATVDLINHAVGAPLAASGLSAAQLEALADPDVLLLDLGGRREVLRNWWQAAARQSLERVRQSLISGFLAGEGMEDLVRRVAGGGPGQPGVLTAINGGPRAQLVTLVRTSVMQVAGQSRLLAYRENADIIAGLEHHSTLDGRTSLPCQVRDGKQWSLDQQPIGGHDVPFFPPPVHPNCRSTLLSVLRSWEELAGPKAMSARHPGRPFLEIMRERLAARGWSQEKITQALADMRSSMGGPVPASLSTEAWMEAHPERARAMLGDVRFKLWKSGKASLRTMLNSAATEPLSLEALLAKIAALRVPPLFAMPFPRADRADRGGWPPSAAQVAELADLPG